MRPGSSLAALLVLVALAASASGDTAPSASPTTLSVGQLNQDFGILRQTLEEAHAGLYRYTPKSEMDARFDSVATELSNPMSDLELYRRLAPLIDLIHDSHTGFRLGRERLTDINKAKRRFFPLDLRYVKGRAFVESNRGPNRDIPVRGEILSINGHPMSAITSQVLLGKTTDGFIRSAKYHALNQSFWFYYFELVDEAEAFRIEVRDPMTAVAQTYTTAGVPADSMANGQFTTRVHKEFHFEVLEGGKVALMSIPTLGDLAIAGRLAETFAEIRRRRIPNLIIDIRDNSGGYDELNTELLSYLVDRPYRFYSGFTYVARDTSALRFMKCPPEDFWTDAELKSMSKAEVARTFEHHTLAEMLEHSIQVNPAAGIHRPKAKDVFHGRLFVLVNGGSGSSAAEIPALLHFLGVGTLIGEEPSGAYQGVTSGVLPGLTLPNSGLRTFVPLIAYHNAVHPGLFEGRGAPPHFEVTQSLDDALAGKDTVLDFTLELIRGRSAR